MKTGAHSQALRTDSSIAFLLWLQVICKLLNVMDQEKNPCRALEPRSRSVVPAHSGLAVWLWTISQSSPCPNSFILNMGGWTRWLSRSLSLWNTLILHLFSVPVLSQSLYNAYTFLQCTGTNHSYIFFSCRSFSIHLHVAHLMFMIRTFHLAVLVIIISFDQSPRFSTFL